MKEFSLDRIQDALSRENIPGWLFYDFQGSDPLTRRMLGIPADAHNTRRWFYWVPQSGSAKKLLHRIEPHALKHLPGEDNFYAGWQELRDQVKKLFASSGPVVAMNYSPNNAIPYVSRVDAGTVELVRGAGIEVVSAADCIQWVEAVLSEDQLQSHIRASKAVREIKDAAFALAGSSVKAGKKVTEYDVQEFIWQEFAKREMESDSRPIVAVGPHAGDPHYAPTADSFSEIKKGDFLLIDLWAKEKTPGAVYADITWTAYLGDKVPDKHEKIFQIVRGARDAALARIRQVVTRGEKMCGWELDEVARTHIREAGYADYFIHRTGHNIGLEVHGVGANLDNFESRDERKLLPHTCFSIEPGIYLPDFGVRSEIDVYLTEKEALVYSEPMQETVLALL